MRRGCSNKLGAPLLKKLGMRRIACSGDARCNAVQISRCNNRFLEIVGVAGALVEKQVIAVLQSVLNLKGRSAKFTSATPLLGDVPELDSMAVVSVITGIEERFGFTVEDDEID